MFVLTSVVSVALAALLTFSAVQKLRGSADVVASYRRVGVLPERLPVLAALLLAGSGGIIAGLAWPSVGIATAACLAAYFLVAIGAHVRHRDLANVATPVVLLVLAVASLVLRGATM